MQWVPQNMISECSDGCSVYIWSSVSVASTSGDSNNYSWKIFSRMAISQYLCYMYYNDYLEDVGQRLNLGSWGYRPWTWIAELQSSPSLCLIYFVLCLGWNLGPWEGPVWSNCNHLVCHFIQSISAPRGFEILWGSWSQSPCPHISTDSWATERNKGLGLLGTMTAQTVGAVGVGPCLVSPGSCVMRQTWQKKRHLMW